jgi:RHS repeat-associated protein
VIARAHHRFILLLAVLLAAFWPTVAGANYTVAGADRTALRLKEEGFTRKTVSWPDSHITLENRAFGAEPAIVFFDGAGNITALMDGNQNTVARYLYDGFGRLTGKWGNLADVNHFRFSSQEIEPASGLYDYGFRFYEPNFQRWLNRDPIQEAGGANLYQFVGNNPVRNVDSYGLRGVPVGTYGPLQPQDVWGPYLPDPAQRPPGWNPNWPTGSDARGEYSQDPNTGTRYYPHNEDPRHWPHYDDSEGERYPEKCEKPRPGQKQKPYGDQSANNPWPEPPAPEQPTPTPTPTPTPPVTPILINPITPIPTPTPIRIPFPIFEFYPI